MSHHRQQLPRLSRQIRPVTNVLFREKATCKCSGRFLITIELFATSFRKIGLKRNRFIVSVTRVLVLFKIEERIAETKPGRGKGGFQIQSPIVGGECVVVVLECSQNIAATEPAFC